MADTTNTTLPNATSADYDAMAPYWQMVETIIAGTDAMRLAGERYLPRFPQERTPDYEYRRRNAPFTNVYADIVGNLAAKPFAEELQVDEAAPEPYRTLAEDIDGRGNSLHVFGAESFFWGVNHAIDWILVDYPKVAAPEGRTLTIADERTQGLRPYWIHVTAPRMLAVYSDVVNGKELFTHARISEVSRQRAGFSETVIERVRVFDREPLYNEFDRVIAYAPATFQLWEKRSKSGVQTTQAWQVVDSGPITIGVIPIVPFITGKRLEGSWRFMPPMRDAAYAQIEHFQAETALKSIKELAAFPMLSGNGVAAPSDKTKEVNVGPRTVLYAPPYGDTGQHGNWTYVEPNGTSLTFLASEIDRLEKQMRELGRQPLTAQSGNLTVVTTMFAAQKGNSAVQAWALNLKDAMEQAFVLTAAWLKRADSPTVSIYTDFGVELGDDKGPDFLLRARQSRDISQATLWEEFRRRNVLSADFDPEQETQRLADEEPPPPSPADLKAALTLVKPPPGTPPGGPAKPKTQEAA